MLAVSRNPALVLDPGLPIRIAAALEMLSPLAGRWSLAAAGGLTPSGGRVCALYSSDTPFIPIHSSPQPLTDPLPDLYLIDATYLRALIARNRALSDSGFETVIAVQGYLDGRVALYAPALTAGINGALRPRDPVKLNLDLQDWFAETLAGAEIPTLMGPVTIERATTEPDDPRTPAARRDLAETIGRVVESHCQPLSLSIVTRTRFTRPHLLERLLTSITRARRDGADIEVVLSSDAPLETCEAAVADLEAKFVNLTLRLQHNPPQGHSRVTNLLAGLRAATGTHVAIMDDDDYVDLFAFEEMQRALFLGARTLLVAGSAVHDEEWTETPSGRHILTRSTERMTYPASGWREMFGGVNCLPVCALVMPRAGLIARLDAFTFEHDLSEDYTLFLLLLTDPALPEIVELPGLFGHISLRAGDHNSVTMEDRRPWARDIALYLTDLTRTASVTGPGQWALLARNETGRDSAAAALDAKTIAELRAGLANRDRQLRLMQSEIARLRALSPPDSNPGGQTPAKRHPNKRPAAKETSA
ncbi:MAG: glycosyltransferase [Alphaproteobacteria bacterium]|nr:glycosyltransferase [Alphaproteobacteria bacterium]